MDTIRDSITGRNCCSQCCLATFSQLEVDNIHSVFSLKTQVEQRQFILDQLILSSSVDSSFAQVIHLKLNGKQVCKQAFVKILGTSYARVKDIYISWKAGVKKFPPRKRKARTLSTKHTTMVAWLEAYAHRLGEKMPHLDQIHLPHFLTKKAVHSIMRSEAHVQETTTHTVHTSFHIYTYACTYTPLHTHTATHTHTHTCLYPHILTHTPIATQIHTHT